MSRRVRRDSETSTDSWSLVSEDHLDDDFSLNSTDNEEAIETEPIVEEPLTTDDEEEEEEDTASEKSLASESEDSEDSDSEDSESEGSEASDLSEQEEEEVEEGEEALEKSESESESEDSDLSDAESVELSDEEEVQEDSEDLVAEIEDHIFEIGEGDEITARSEVEAALKCKEDMEWMYEEVGDMSDSPARKIIRVLFAFSLFMVLFPLAEIFTSWTLNVKLQRTPQVEYSTLVFDSYSPQSYDAVKRSFAYKTKEESEQGLRQWRRQQKVSRNTLHLLEKILNPKTEDLPKHQTPLKSFEILELFKNQTYNWKHQSEPRIEEIKKVDQKLGNVHFNQSLFGQYKALNLASKLGKNLNSRQKRQIFKSSRAQCQALAPVPPAPFSPRKVQKLQYPRHQPCFVHVNQSKWTCQKSQNLPSVIYHQDLSAPNFTVLPRKYSTLQKKHKAWGVTAPRKSQQKYDICGKKASASMRTTSKPTDTCHSRQLPKFTPRKVHKVAPVAPPKKVHKVALPEEPCVLRTPGPSIYTLPERRSWEMNESWESRRSSSRAEERYRRIHGY